ncbi:gastric triacylglycerol lipase-like [Chelonus insularis]|uniref:gastric triacylglycerol lipase-like n=1 Tax=Chelonus insularis TaxID=460826 RepID=UPI00158A6ACF|nr:gastric triacylglycerol lipase-like [Chelonus insularis]
MHVDLVTKTGYIAEEHEVITEDGYYLLLHRISGGPQNPVRPGKPVVLLLHGLMGASDIWVLRGPRYDIAYQLVDNGFDVWALNVRGNFYCKRHRNYSDKDVKFWQFSWHEIGFYDLPASIDYILSLTQQSKISLIGYSMGATEEFVLLSTRPKYNTKVNVALAWAPVVIVTHELPGLFINFMLRYGNQLEKVFQFFNFFELFPRLSTKQLNTAEFWLKLCWNRSVQSLCHRLMDFIFGVNNLNIDLPTLKRFWSHYPQGTSIRTIIHYGQIVLRRKFTQYDFGSDENHRKYNNVEPAEYPIENISTPLIIYHSSGDDITNKQVLAINKFIHVLIKDIITLRSNHLLIILGR